MFTKYGRTLRKAETRGRRKVIYLHKTTFDNWNKLRENLSENRGKQMTNNEFAVYHLNRISILIFREQEQIFSGSTLGRPSHFFDHALADSSY